MKTLLKTFVLFWSLSLQAQPNFQVPYNLLPGYTYTYKEITNASNYQNVATTGANVVWDFTRIQLATQIRTDSILSLQQSRFPASFPSASYVLQEPRGLQQFYEIKQDTVYYLGNSYNNQPSVFSPGLPVFTLPLAYQSVLPNKFSQNTAPGYSQQWKGSYRYEAYGTLNLPNGITYTDVGLYSSITGESNGNVSYLNYSFFRANDRIPILRIQLQQTGSFVSVQTAFLTESFPSITLKENPAFSNISIYPNPAHGQVQIANLSSKHSTVSVITLGGKKLIEQKTDLQNISLDVSDIPKGMYFNEVKNEFGINRKPLLVN